MKDPEKHISGTDEGTVFTSLPKFPSLNTENNLSLNYDEKPRKVSFLVLDDNERNIMRSFIAAAPFEKDRFSRMQ